MSNLGPKRLRVSFTCYDLESEGPLKASPYSTCPGQIWAIKECCQMVGGRSWEVGFHLMSYLATLGKRNASLAREVSTCLGEPGDALGQILYGIFCAPSVCEGDVGPLAMQRLIYNVCRLHVRPPPFEDVAADELTNWRSISMDFAVAGVGRCGTQSVLNNLYQHPEIDFTLGKSEEDYTLFGQGQLSKFVPTKQQVAKHRASYAGKGDANDATKLLGLNNPVIVTYPLSYYALYLMKTVKVVLVVCDPLRRLEKLFLYHHYCHEDFDAAVRRFDAIPRHLNTRKDCDRSARALIGNQRKWAKNQAFGSHVEELIKLFGHRRLFIVHQASLREFPRQTYGKLAAWLGATQPFAAETIFKRYNFRLGYRTDLCQNSSLQNVLRLASMVCRLDCPICNAAVAEERLQGSNQPS